MRELINFYFTDEGKTVTQYGATQTNKKDKFKTNFNKAFLKLAINFFLIIVFLILLICPFGKSLLFLWILVQYISSKINIYIFF